MKALLAALTAAAALSAPSASIAAPTWTEGTHYVVVTPVGVQPLGPGQCEVAEVFSYGCPACAAFNPVAQRLQKALPKGAKFVYVPAAFNPAEDWPMFQRAYITAESLGIAQKTHDAMFDAVWKGGELAIIDPVTRQLRDPLPTIEDAARFYSRRTGVKVGDFLSAARSFSVDMKIREADRLIRSYQALSTPTIIVNRRYRTDAQSAGGYDELIQLVTWLAAKDRR